jgi:predicted PurR-regulated permease PerM
VSAGPPERIVSVRPRTVLSTAGLLVALACALWVVYIAREALTWVIVAAFLALAVEPAVARVQHATGIRRGLAAALVGGLTLIVLLGIGFLAVPPVAHQVSDLVAKVPHYVDDLTHGEGPLGFLQSRYRIVDKLRSAIEDGGTARLAGGASAVLSITKGVITAVVAIFTIAVLTFFMILEGPAWVERFYALMGSQAERRWRAVGSRVARTVSGYVTGNLLISFIAGSSSALVLYLVGAPFPLALGLLVAILDLIPLAGATVAGIVIAAVAMLTSVTAGIIVIGYFVIYQQVENHVLQPLVYGRTVQLSPLVALVALLIGVEVAGVLGALGAIPVAGTLQILASDWLEHRRGRSAHAQDGGQPSAVRTGVTTWSGSGSG